MPFEMIDSERTILVFNLDAQTNELVSSESFYVAPGTGLPADSTDLQPPAELAGYARVFDIGNQAWQQVEDHRGQIVYHKETAEALTVNTLGALTDAYTSLKPGSDFDKWDGTQWVKDEDAEKQSAIEAASTEKRTSLENANLQIQIFTDAVTYALATKGEKLLLKLWGIYRVQLNRINVDDAPDIMWPSPPATSTDASLEAQAELEEQAAKEAAEAAAANEPSAPATEPSESETDKGTA